MRLRRDALHAWRKMLSDVVAAHPEMPHGLRLQRIDGEPAVRQYTANHMIAAWVRRDTNDDGDRHLTFICGWFKVGCSRAEAEAEIDAVRVEADATLA